MFDKVKQELERRGYDDVSIVETIKNNVKMKGIVVGKKEDKIRPTFYFEDEEFDDIEKVCDEIEEFYINNREDDDDIHTKMEDIVNRKGIVENVEIKVQRSFEETNVVHRPTIFDGIDQYLSVSWAGEKNQNYSVRITSDMLKHFDIDENDLWKIAEAHTFTPENFEIMSMKEVLKKMEQSNSIPDWIFNDETFTMFVLSNKNRLHGAVQVFNKKVFDEWGRSHGFKNVMILPSSIHEVIVINIDDDCDIKECTKIVKFVNQNNVKPTEQLSDKAYQYIFE